MAEARIPRLSPAYAKLVFDMKHLSIFGWCKYSNISYTEMDFHHRVQRAGQH